jgi:hypothetical protein
METADPNWDNFTITEGRKEGRKEGGVSLIFNYLSSFGNLSSIFTGLSILKYVDGNLLNFSF